MNISRADWETYAASSLIEDAVLRRLQVLGESTQKLSQSTKDVYPEIPWAQIAGMRNVLTHGYFSINPELVRHTVENDLPKLRRVVTAILASREG